MRNPGWERRWRNTRRGMDEETLVGEDEETLDLEKIRKPSLAGGKMRTPWT
jgi:hypothetical protein